MTKQKAERAYHAFHCPYCDVELNPGRGPIIKMKGRLEGPGFAVTTDLFLSSSLGVYGRLTGNNVELRDGAKIEFMCPSCGSPFSEPEEDLAQIVMRDEQDRTLVVSFNKNYGKRSTFVTDQDEPHSSEEFGDDANDFREDLHKRQNFFGT